MEGQTASESVYIINRALSEQKSASRVRLASLNYLVETGEAPFPSYRNYLPHPQTAAGLGGGVSLALDDTLLFLFLT